MSGHDLRQPSGSLPFAWLGGALAAAMFALVAHLGLIAVLASPAALSASLQMLPAFLLYALAIDGVTMLVLVGIMAFLESGNSPRPFRTWLVAGLVATTPLALVGFLLANLGDPVEGAPQFDYRTFLAPAFFYACGLIGAATAFRIRHGSWRA
jgi:hypothetical protein